MTTDFTFREEVCRPYDLEVYDLFMDVFDAMPIAALIANKHLAMHGGISPELHKLEQINKINRFQEIPLDGIFSDMLWSDPMADDKGAHKNFEFNHLRDCSYLYGKKPVSALLKQNKLLSIFRGHEV